MQGTEGARVLIESSDPALAWAGEHALRESGYDVAVCWGPVGKGGTPCPVLDGEHCTLAEDADVIVQSFAVGERKTFPILQAIRGRFPDKPLCVEIPGPSRHKYGDELLGCTVLELPMSRDELVAAVQRARAI